MFVRQQERRKPARVHDGDSNERDAAAAVVVATGRWKIIYISL
jgi:hypothetical protein